MKHNGAAPNAEQRTDCRRCERDAVRLVAEPLRLRQSSTHPGSTYYGHDDPRNFRSR
jgi:hypothetical protein